jgi:hypothetical protein
MRGFGAKWSPDSPGSDAMKTQTEPENPEARDLYLQLLTDIHKNTSGKPLS